VKIRSGCRCFHGDIDSSREQGCQGKSAKIIEAAFGGGACGAPAVRPAAGGGGGAVPKRAGSDDDMSQPPQTYGRLRHGTPGLDQRVRRDGERGMHEPAGWRARHDRALGRPLDDDPGRASRSGIPVGFWRGPGALAERGISA
jgi:hypothetical protein